MKKCAGDELLYSARLALQANGKSIQSRFIFEVNFILCGLILSNIKFFKKLVSFKKKKKKKKSPFLCDDT